MDHNKLWKILSDESTSLLCPDKPVCGPRSNRIEKKKKTKCLKTGKGIRQGCILSLSLFNLYPEYIMQNAGLDDAQVGIKIAWRNINNLRHSDDMTLIAESEEELKT